jgi:predicted oxidoreductase
MNGATLQATVTRYNSFVVAGADTDFGKPVSLLSAQINTPPYYAAFHPIYVRDWYGGLHINTQSQVIDLDGNVIPHFYAAGEDAQAGCMHGMTKCFIFGRIAGTAAAQESPL